MILGQGTEASLFIDIVFWVIAVSSIVAAVAVVQLRDVFRAALFLIVSFLAVAGMFVLLRAEFLAAVQVVIYVGAISILIIFAVLMTRDVEEGSPSHRLQVPVAVVAALFMGIAIFVVVETRWELLEAAELTPAVSDRVVDVFSNTTPWIARLLINDFVLAFEVASVLLLAAIVGALALIREDSP
jgi:NADH-quinone oxidoreductase subunit J